MRDERYLIIKDVLYESSEMEINLGSKAAREYLAEKIYVALYEDLATWEHPYEELP